MDFRFLGVRPDMNHRAAKKGPAEIVCPEGSEEKHLPETAGVFLLVHH